MQAGAPGKKTSWAQTWRRKGREGRLAVSSASRGSREENVMGAKLTEKRTRGAPCSFKCKQGLQGRKRQGRQIDGEKDERGTYSFKCKQVLQGRERQGRQIDGENDERCAMQFQVQAGATGKKTSGAPNWRRKGREGCHAVSSASRGSREENVMSAKLTEKRTRGAPWSFKCKQGLQGRKRQGRQIDGEKDERGAYSFKCKQVLQGQKRQGRQIDGENDERCAMQFQVQAGDPGKKMSAAPNWWRKGREECHAVSSASWGSREENVRGAKLTEKKTRYAPCSFRCKQGLQGRKRQGRQIHGEKRREGHLQFQVQAGAPGKKTSGAPNCRRKGREECHAVSSASRGSREENVRGAKLTEKKTRDAPCSFRCKQGLQGRKRQGRQIDGEKENKSLNCQTYFPFGLKMRNVVFLNSITMMLVSFTFLLYSTTPRQCRP